MIDASPNIVRLDADAFLIDLDGTLVDSSGPVERAWTAWCTRHNVALLDVLAISEGKQANTVIAALRPDLDAAAENQWMLELQIVDVEGVAAVRGAAEFLARLDPQRWAVVTSGTHALATARLRAADLPIPDVLVTADEVTNSKPAPDGFLLAAHRLGIAPTRCVVFEDSASGLEAGRRAGMTTIAITAASRHAVDDTQLAVPDWAALHQVNGYWEFSRRA